MYKSKNLATHTSGKDDVSDSISVNGGGTSGNINNERVQISKVDLKDEGEGLQTLSLGAKMGIKLSDDQNDITNI